MRENRTHGSEGGDGESRFRPLSVRVSPGFPLKACGNDGLWENWHLRNEWSCSDSEILKLFPTEASI